jgi:osmotically-inducible protein OsmY
MHPRGVALFTAIRFSSLPLAGRAAPDNRNKICPEPNSSQQTESKSDGNLTAKIRQSIVADKSLSTNAHNVEISTRNGLVTLRGPVASEREKRLVQQRASDVVGLRHLTSELEVRL